MKSLLANVLLNKILAKAPEVIHMPLKNVDRRKELVEGSPLTPELLGETFPSWSKE